MARNRVSSWSSLDDHQWRYAVSRDLDGHDEDITELRQEVLTTAKAVRAELDEVKESNKWVIRTMVGLLVAVLMLLAGVVANVVIP